MQTQSVSPSLEDQCAKNLAFNSTVYVIVYTGIPEAKNTSEINSQEVLLPSLNLMRILDQIKAISPGALKA